MAPQNTVNQANECFDTAPTVEIPEDQPIATPQSPSNHTVLDFPATATERAKIHQENFEVQTSQSPPEQLKRSTRITILALVITCLFVGRFSVPSNEPPCVVDHILNAFESANKFINTPGNEIYRSTFQFICSLFVDITFVITFGYWALKARTVRLPLSMALFYIVRALIQKVWLSPFPEGYWWYSPGIPSFVVPYGRGSDFFFSGHTGFLILCACEWNKLGFKKVRNFVYGVAAYTILILFIYRIHYTIDIFTAIIFADWCFGKIDNAKERIENTTVFIIMNIKQFINRITRKQSIPEEKFVAA